MSRSRVRRVLARLPEPGCRRAELSVAAYCSAFGERPREEERSVEP